MTLPMVAEAQPRALALADDELIPVLRSSLYPGAKDESIKLVIGYCRAAGLDPMQKPVHLVPMNVKKVGGGRDDYEWRDVVMPGIGLYRVQAARTGQLAGIDEPVFGPLLSKYEVEFPEWCKVTVYRMIGGQRVPFTACEFWLENYATAKRESLAPNAMWKKRPRGQLAKCAEAQALRKAFPELGTQPTADETIIETGDAFEAAPAASTQQFTVGRKSAAGPQPPAAAPVPSGVVDVEPKAAPAPSPAAAASEPAAGAPAAPAAHASEGTVGDGEIAYLRNKAKQANVSLVDLAAQLGGLVIEAGKLSKLDFDRIKAELRSREG
jgi:phage recombination protein Bet